MKEIKKVFCLKYLNMFSVPLQMLAVCVGMFQGAIQALSRSYFAKIIPPTSPITTSRSIQVITALKKRTPTRFFFIFFFEEIDDFLFERLFFP